MPGVGILIGSHQGRVFRLEGEVLEPYLELPATLERVRFVSPFEDGLALVLGANYLGAHHPEYGTCGARPFAPGTVSVTRPFALGERIVSASVGGDDVLPFLLVLERGEKPRPRCLSF